VIREARQMMGRQPKFEVGSMPMTKSTQGSKRKVATLTFTSSTTKHCQSICKKLVVFQYMGTDVPSEFSRLDKHILLNGIL